MGSGSTNPGGRFLGRGAGDGKAGRGDEGGGEGSEHPGLMAHRILLIPDTVSGVVAVLCSGRGRPNTRGRANGRKEQE